MFSVLLDVQGDLAEIVRDPRLSRNPVDYVTVMLLSCSLAAALRTEGPDAPQHGSDLFRDDYASRTKMSLGLAVLEVNGTRCTSTLTIHTTRLC